MSPVAAEYAQGLWWRRLGVTVRAVVTAGAARRGACMCMGIGADRADS